MSTYSVDLFQARLRAELNRLELKPVDAARLSGLGESQPIRDVIGGRKRLSADLLASLIPAGVDVAYVLTGQAAAFITATDEQALLDGYRLLDDSTKRRLRAFVLGVEPLTTPVQKRIKVSAPDGNAAGRDIAINVKRGRKKK